MNALEAIAVLLFFALLSYIGMDAAIIVLCWLVMGVFALGFIGEFVLQPYRDQKCKSSQPPQSPPTT